MTGTKELPEESIIEIITSVEITHWRKQGYSFSDVLLMIFPYFQGLSIFPKRCFCQFHHHVLPISSYPLAKFKQNSILIRASWKVVSSFRYCVLNHLSTILLKAYSAPSQTSKMELFTTTVNAF